MQAAWQRLAMLCQSVGAKVPWWTQGAGGNVSCKDGDDLLIKASGVRLDAVGPLPSVARLSRSALVADLATSRQHDKGPAARDALYTEALARHRAPGFGRPSMEAGMHAVLPGRDVLHLHALSAIWLAWQAARAPDDVAARLGRHGLDYALVPPSVPGAALCAAVAATVHAPVLLLANHGLVLQGDGPELLLAWQQVERELLGELPAARQYDAPEAMAGEWLMAPILASPKLPDAAVFWPRLLAVTEPCSPPSEWRVAGAQLKATAGADAAHWRRLTPSRAAADRDATELWAALVALHGLVPALPTLSASFSATVSALPEERWRRRATAPPRGRAGKTPSERLLP